MRKLLVIAALTLCHAAQAHEIGTSRVSAQFRSDRTYLIEIVTDATNLVEKLEAASGRPPVSPAEPPQIIETLHANEPVFRGRVGVRFDSEAVQPQISYAVTPAPNATSAVVATIRLTGQIPAAAQHFTWNYGWTYATYAMTVLKAAGDPGTQWLEGDQRSKPIALAETTASSRLETIARYLLLGFTHIVPHGLDHMLFVLGIYLLSNRPKSVLLQVSAFTIAHSITLGLSVYGIVDAPSRVVEPVIAISIAYVAVENLFLADLKPWRIALVFAFGLLHGLGFAGALRESGIPRSEFLTALLTFNVGVEAGQLTVIAAAFLLFGWKYSERTWYRQRIVVPASVAIAIAAFYWTFERIIA
jgi:hydrogenase/urease accessory protein HupE